jgi:hypothetical protein
MSGMSRQSMNIGKFTPMEGFVPFEADSSTRCIEPYPDIISLFISRDLLVGWASTFGSFRSDSDIAMWHYAAFQLILAMAVRCRDDSFEGMPYCVAFVEECYTTDGKWSGYQIFVAHNKEICQKAVDKRQEAADLIARRSQEPADSESVEDDNNGGLLGDGNRGGEDEDDSFYDMAAEGEGRINPPRKKRKTAPRPRKAPPVKRKTSEISMDEFLRQIVETPNLSKLVALTKPNEAARFIERRFGALNAVRSKRNILQMFVMLTCDTSTSRHADRFYAPGSDCSILSAMSLEIAFKRRLRAQQRDGDSRLAEFTEEQLYDEAKLMAVEKSRYLTPTNDVNACRLHLEQMIPNTGLGSIMIPCRQTKFDVPEEKIPELVEMARLSGFRLDPEDSEAVKYYFERIFATNGDDKFPLDYELFTHVNSKEGRRMRKMEHALRRKWQMKCMLHLGALSQLGAGLSPTQKMIQRWANEWLSHKLNFCYQTGSIHKGIDPFCSMMASIYAYLEIYAAVSTSHKAIGLIMRVMCDASRANNSLYTLLFIAGLPGGGKSFGTDTCIRMMIPGTVQEVGNMTDKANTYSGLGGGSIRVFDETPAQLTHDKPFSLYDMFTIQRHNGNGVGATNSGFEQLLKQETTRQYYCTEYLQMVDMPDGGNGAKDRQKFSATNWKWGCTIITGNNNAPEIPLPIRDRAILMEQEVGAAADRDGRDVIAVMVKQLNPVSMVGDEREISIMQTRQYLTSLIDAAVQCGVMEPVHHYVTDSIFNLATQYMKRMGMGDHRRSRALQKIRNITEVSIKWRAIHIVFGLGIHGPDRNRPFHITDILRTEPFLVATMDVVYWVMEELQSVFCSKIDQRVIDKLYQLVHLKQAKPNGNTAYYEMPTPYPEMGEFAVCIDLAKRFMGPYPMMTTFCSVVQLTNTMELSSKSKVCLLNVSKKGYISVHEIALNRSTQRMGMPLVRRAIVATVPRLTETHNMLRPYTVDKDGEETFCVPFEDVIEPTTEETELEHEHKAHDEKMETARRQAKMAHDQLMRAEEAARAAAAKSAASAMVPPFDSVVAAAAAAAAANNNNPNNRQNMSGAAPVGGMPSSADMLAGMGIALRDGTAASSSAIAGDPEEEERAKRVPFIPIADRFTRATPNYVSRLALRTAMGSYQIDSEQIALFKTNKTEEVINDLDREMVSTHLGNIGHDQTERHPAYPHVMREYMTILAEQTEAHSKWVTHCESAELDADTEEQPEEPVARNLWKQFKRRDAALKSITEEFDQLDVWKDELRNQDDPFMRAVDDQAMASETARKTKNRIKANAHQARYLYSNEHSNDSSSSSSSARPLDRQMSSSGASGSRHSRSNGSNSQYSNNNDGNGSRSHRIDMDDDMSFSRRPSSSRANGESHNRGPSRAPYGGSGYLSDEPHHSPPVRQQQQQQRNNNNNNHNHEYEEEDYTDYTEMGGTYADGEEAPMDIDTAPTSSSRLPRSYEPPMVRQLSSSSSGNRNGGGGMPRGDGSSSSRTPNVTERLSGRNGTSSKGGKSTPTQHQPTAAAKALASTSKLADRRAIPASLLIDTPSDYGEYRTGSSVIPNEDSQEAVTVNRVMRMALDDGWDGGSMTYASSSSNNHHTVNRPPSSSSTAGLSGSGRLSRTISSSSSTSSSGSSSSVRLPANKKRNRGQRESTETPSASSSSDDTENDHRLSNIMQQMAKTSMCTGHDESARDGMADTDDDDEREEEQRASGSRGYLSSTRRAAVDTDDIALEQPLRRKSNAHRSNLILDDDDE